MDAQDQSWLTFFDMVIESSWCFFLVCFLFSKTRALKDTGCGISKDFPREIVGRRKALEKKRGDTRKDGKRAFYSRTEPDKLDWTINPFLKKLFRLT